MDISQSSIREFFENPLLWLESNASRIIFLIIVLVVTAVVVKVVTKGMRLALDKTDIPSASIFINIVRVLLWVLAASIVLQPVFGINPTTLMTALGVGGIAVSFGLKDTIANIIGGFGLMLGKVVQPGDLVSINGATGIVKDVTWRHTIVVERAGNEMWIPNSVLNTAALEKMPEPIESMTTIPFTVRGGKDVDTDAIAAAIIESVQATTKDIMLPDNPPLVKFSGFSPYGIEGKVLLFTKPGVLLSTMQDRAARAIAGKGFLVQNAAPEDDDEATPVISA
ncbi:transporter [Bifidobacterium primatium]|uniref:Transporter n=1 Tax=Bifidobacterium primatium TaxID=2045438 RepID=A0A2M9H8S0_9BIFI|nr:mechanosensitive ion channel domain-containing protein [Bifidobacterium primatium]PJM73211.1 transporter [Bifidobacterium primatium]